jgi:hypothetical protein
MDPFDDKYWNLAQAAAWVVYREKKLLTQFEHPTREGFMSLGLYSSMEPTSRQKFGSLRDLSLALTNERLQAWGYRANDDSYLEAIPGLEWPDLDLAPPLAYHVKNRPQKYQLWTNIRVESAAAKKLWRTAGVRPTLPHAPGFHVRAPVFGSGKTHLCELIGAFAGPGGNAKVSYPTTFRL